MATRRLGLILCVLLLSSTGAIADCLFNGRPYPEGSRVGIYVCENGKWVVRR